MLLQNGSGLWSLDSTSLLNSRSRGYSRDHILQKHLTLMIYAHLLGSVLYTPEKRAPYLVI